MKNKLFLMFGLLACISGITGIIVLGFFDNPTIFKVALTATAIFSVLFVMFDPHNITKKAVVFVGYLCIIALVIIMFSSCYTSGYGCKGNSRCMTRVR